MKFGIRNTSFFYPDGSGTIWENTRTHIQRAEADRFDAFWVMDHFYQLPVHRAVEKPLLDAWTVLPRMNFGFGAGGFKPEYQAYGFEFIEKPSIRLDQMKEALQPSLGL